MEHNSLSSPEPKKSKKPDWMTQDEYDKHTRHVWNQIQAAVDHPNPRVRKVTTVLTYCFVVSLVFCVCAGLIALGIDMLT